MPYEVTATRKRPQTFTELVGQEFVAATLTNALRQGAIAHAYLFAGPRGVGKTSVARILAKALNCEKGPNDTPCGTCASCLEIARSAALDVIEIDGASNTSVNDVREIRDEVLFAPQKGRYKVYIIDEVHMLSNSAFNALLKTIEEPPPYVVFIFATTEVHKVPATIRSRCQQYNFRLISAAEIRDKLREAASELGVKAEDKALTWIAKEATGSLRDAYTLLDQVVSFSGGSVTLEAIREKLGVLGIDELNAFVRPIAEGDPAKVLEQADAILAKGVSIEQFTADLAGYFRDLLFLRTGVTRDTLLGYAAADFAQEVVGRWTPLQLEKAVELLLAFYRGIRFSLNPRFELELALSRLARLDDLVSPAELREAIAELRSGTGSPGRPPAKSEPARPLFLHSDKPPASASSPAATAKTSATAAQAPVSATASSGSSTAAAMNPTPASSPGSSASADPRDLVARLMEAFRREKPAVVAALEKAAASIEGQELVLAFSPQNRFHGERALKEKDALNERLAAMAAVHVRVSFVEARPETRAEDQRVELLRKVFRGEVVKGEDHGGQPV
ncbi:MAG: DNA polymerase III, subunit gamma and tau [Spirochaetes bacterium RBG_13_68_11]|nr:MAG: DNA polymerase III, subunit gamma and tau [Spirochaetes bacterium RBG_13_68_11]